MPRDRYVAYEAGEADGRLLTVRRQLGHPLRLMINARVDPANGELRVRVLNRVGQPYPGFDWPDVTPVKGDRVDHPVQWSGHVSDLSGKEVQFEFRLKRAGLFAFELQ
jgi:hypothetical protein